MANEGNLKPFKKGHDDRRNLKGRIPPMETNELKRLLLKYSNQKVKVGDRIMTKAELIAERLVDEAVRGKMSALRILLDRTEGKAPTQEQILRRSQKEKPNSDRYKADNERIIDVFREADEEEKLRDTTQ